MHYINLMKHMFGWMFFFSTLSILASVQSFEHGSSAHSVIAMPSLAVISSKKISSKTSSVIDPSVLPSSLKEDQKDSGMFDAYAQYLASIKDGMSSVKVEKVSFPVSKDAHSDQKFIRNGFLVTRPDALGTVIICHGYTQSKHESFFFRALFSHFNVLAFDFRAHGDLVDNQHSTIGQDEMYDVYGAVQFVQKNITQVHPELVGKPIIGLGFSMGAVALLLAQAHYGNLFDILILDSPFDSSTECMERRIDEMLSYKLLPGKKMIRAAIMKALYNPRFQSVIKPVFHWATGLDPYLVATQFVPVIPIDQAAKITIPCFFISCENDIKVDFTRVKRLYDAVHAPFKRLWITQGTQHCGSCIAQPEIYFYKVNKFIKKCLSKQWAHKTKIIDDRTKADGVVQGLELV